MENKGIKMLQEHTHDEISKAIVRSQHAQRNFDLTKRADFGLRLSFKDSTDSAINLTNK